MPDLSIVTRAPVNDNTLCNRYIIESFQRSQHRPVLLQNLAGIFHLLIGSRLLQTSITLFDSSLLAWIHMNGFQTPLELPQNVMYHVVFIRRTF
jgi:hypothetical protein